MRLAVADQVFSLGTPKLGPSSVAEPSLTDLGHPVAAYLNGLAPASRRPQLSALDWIARRATQIYTAETLPWQRLRRSHVLRSGACSRSTTSLPPPIACSPPCVACFANVGAPR
jgi:hypothetical protein